MHEVMLKTDLIVQCYQFKAKQKQHVNKLNNFITTFYTVKRVSVGAGGAEAACSSLSLIQRLK